MQIKFFWLFFSLKTVSEDVYNKSRKKRHLEACTAFSTVDLSKKGDILARQAVTVKVQI